MHGTWENLGKKYGGPNFGIFHSREINTTVSNLNMIDINK